jgi:predicted thioesterase
MKTGLIPGLIREETYVTTAEMRARQLTSDVFSTPAMIGLMEGTCVRLAEPFLDDYEQTVGTHVDVRHRAPTRIGQSVTIKAELLDADGKRLRFSVEAWNDEAVRIGDGTHRRAIIDTKAFAAARDRKNTPAPESQS